MDREAPQGIDAQQLPAARVALQAPTRADRLLESVNVRTLRQAVEMLLLRAQLPDADSTEASAALVQAVSDGEPLGLVRTFLDEGGRTEHRAPSGRGASSAAGRWPGAAARFNRVRASKGGAPGSIIPIG